MSSARDLLLPDTGPQENLEEITTLIDQATKVINNEKPDFKELERIYFDLTSITLALEPNHPFKLAEAWLTYEYGRLFKETHQYGAEVKSGSFEGVLEEQFAWKRTKEHAKSYSGWDYSWKKKSAIGEETDEEKLKFVDIDRADIDPLKKFILDDFVYQMIASSEKYALDLWIAEDKKDGKPYDGALADRILEIKKDKNFNLLPIIDHDGNVIPLREIKDDYYLIKLLLDRHSYGKDVSLAKLSFEEFYYKFSLPYEKPSEEKNEAPKPIDRFTTLKKFSAELASFFVTVSGATVAGAFAGSPLFGVGALVGAVIGFAAGIISWASGFGIIKGIQRLMQPKPIEKIPSCVVLPIPAPLEGTSSAKITELLGVPPASIVPAPSINSAPPPQDNNDPVFYGLIPEAPDLTPTP